MHVFLVVLVYTRGFQDNGIGCGRGAAIVMLFLVFIVVFYMLLHAICFPPVAFGTMASVVVDGLQSLCYSLLNFMSLVLVNGLERFIVVLLYCFVFVVGSFKFC